RAGVAAHARLRGLAPRAPRGPPRLRLLERARGGPRAARGGDARLRAHRARPLPARGPRVGLLLPLVHLPDDVSSPRARDPSRRGWGPVDVPPLPVARRAPPRRARGRVGPARSPSERRLTMATETKSPVLAAKGGSFLVEDRGPDEVFTPEDFT